MDDLLHRVTAATAGAYGDEFVRRLLREVQHATGVELAFVAEVVDDGRVHVFAFHRGDDDVWDGIEEQSGPRLTDVLGDDAARNAELMRAWYGGPTYLDEIGMRSAYAVPLHGPDGVYVGYLGLVDTEREGPSPAQAEALRLLAGRAAVEVERRRAERRLREARVRLVEAADAERRRLERNLHDGAQQRLVALALSLRLLEARLRDDEAAGLVRAASAELAEALAELRELARGIHPAVLSERGLPQAVESLAARSPVPVVVHADLPERPAEPVEAAAYYVVAEALTNVAKHGGASAARVLVARAGGMLRVEVADDGAGGAAAARGSGLAGLADRVEALGGRLEVVSPPGEGTLVRAELPFGGPAAAW